MNLKAYLGWANTVYGIMAKVPVEVMVDYHNQIKTYPLNELTNIVSNLDYNIETYSDSIDVAPDKITLFVEVDYGAEEKEKRKDSGFII